MQIDNCKLKIVGIHLIRTICRAWGTICNLHFAIVHLQSAFAAAAQRPLLPGEVPDEA
jgi:hypothetical protein